MNVLIIALLAFALQNATVQGPAGSIEGTAYASGSADPMAGVTMELRRMDDTVEYTVVTGRDGRFAFPRIVPDSYRLGAVRQGFVNAEYGQGKRNRGEPIQVTPGLQMAGIRIDLTPTGAVHGRIYDPAGKPVVNAEVQALKPGYRNGVRTLAPIQTTLTDDLGNYRLYWLTPGQYYVGTTAPNWNTVPSQVLLNPVPGGPPAASGRVASGGIGAPPDLLAPIRSPSARAATERFVPIYFPNTADGDAAQLLDVRPGADIANIDLLLSPIRTRRVRGIVIDGDTGQPAKGSVDNPQARTILLRISPAIAGSPPLQASSATGEFDVQVLPAATGIAATLGPRFGKVTLPAGDADVSGIQIVLKPGFDIPGQITIEGSAADVSEARLPALRVLLRGDPLGGASQGGGASGGTFTAQNVPPGSYRVDVQPLLDPNAPLPNPPPALYVKSIRFGGADVLNSPFQLTGPAEDGARIEVVLASARGSIGGTIVDAGLKPLAEATVVLMPDIEHRQRRDLYRTAVSDASGRFRINGVPVGNYKVFAWEDIELGVWLDFSFMRQHENRGREIRVDEGSSQDIQMNGIPASR